MLIKIVMLMMMMMMMVMVMVTVMMIMMVRMTRIMMMMITMVMMVMMMRGRWWEEDDDVDVEEEEEEEDDVEEEDRSQDRLAHFLRACAVEMHTGISQDPFCIILYRNLQEKWPRTPPGTSFCASLGIRKAHRHFTRAILYGNL